MTDSAASSLHFGLRPEELLKAVRHRELLRAMQIIGVKDVVQTDFADGQCQQLADTIKQYMINAVRSFKPEAILVFEPNGV